MKLGGTPALATHAAQVTRKTAATKPTSVSHRNLLVPGIAALAVLGGIGFVLASRKSGDSHVTKNDIRNDIINNSYFAQLIASGATTRKDLERLAVIAAYRDGFIGISKEAVAWSEATKFAVGTASSVLDPAMLNASGGPRYLNGCERYF